MLTLDDFISETLKQIIDGVKTAQKHAVSRGAKVNPAGKRLQASTRTTHETEPRSTIVEFDIALAAHEGKQKKGGVGVFLASVGVGGQAQSEATVSSTSRVKFRLRLLPPVQYTK
jgi:hypothetical protein